MAKKVALPKRQVTNRRARFDYDLSDELVAGLVLTGAETKALRRGHGSLSGAYVNVVNGELWLVGATIYGDGQAPIVGHQQTRSRKLLVKQRQRDQLVAARQRGLSLVPVSILSGGRFIKLKLAVGRGRRRPDKRQLIKQREASRQTRHLSER